MMMNDKMMTRKELAQLLLTSPGYISNQIHLGREGLTIPPSIKLGRKRLWLESLVYEWLLERVSIVPRKNPIPVRLSRKSGGRKKGKPKM